MSLTSTAGYVARRAAQRERVRILYRRALKDTLNWAVHRHLFYQDVPPSNRSHKKSSIFHLFISILIIELLSLFFFFFSICEFWKFSLSLSGFGAPRTFRSPQTRGSFSLFLASIFNIWINFYFFSIRNSIFLAHNVVL